VLRTADACFGHRLMMDRIVPGGVAQDIALEGLACGGNSPSWSRSTTTPPRCRIAP
jgi:hypothetical protein